GRRVGLWRKFTQSRLEATIAVRPQSNDGLRLTCLGEPGLWQCDEGFLLATVGEARHGLTNCDHLTWLGERGGDHAVGIGLEVGIGELVAREIERALRAVEAALCFIACRLLAVEVGQRGPTAEIGRASCRE